MSSTWVNAALSGASLAAGLVFLPAAARRHRGRSACLAHALMGIGMAGMFSPWGDPVPAAAGAAVFLVIGLWFAARGLRTDRLGAVESVHLVIGPAAMVLMYAVMGSAHGVNGTHTGGGSPVLSVAALALIGYFVWYAWFLTGQLPRPAACGAAAGPGGVAAAGTGVVTAAGTGVVTVAERVVAVRPVAVAHVAMCVLMALMFLGRI